MLLFLTQSWSRRQKWNAIFLAILFLALLAYSIFIDPRDVSLLSCRFKGLTGYNCPTCGLSRSFYAMANLDISASFGYHIIGPFLYLGAVVLFIKSVAEIILDRKIEIPLSALYPKIVFIIAGSAWFIYWIANLYQG